MLAAVQRELNRLGAGALNVDADLATVSVSRDGVLWIGSVFRFLSKASCLPDNAGAAATFVQLQSPDPVSAVMPVGEEE
jgi:hypothetical protein